MSASATEIRLANEAKVEFDDAYSQPDPRSYFRTLREHDYQIPENARSTFERIFNNYRRLRGKDQLSLLDVGCSYGVNAGLLRYGLKLESLYRRYADPECATLSSDELRERDTQFFSSLPQDNNLTIAGLDVSGPAVRYAEAVSLLDRGIDFDLEAASFDPSELPRLDQTDIIISTGCVGYVTATTFNRLLEAIGPKKPWIASFVLRMFPYDRIAEVCAAHGLVTYKLTGRTFVQRRFADEEERDGVLERLHSRGLSVVGLEERGCLHAEFFLSVSEADASALRLQVPWKTVDQP